MAQERQPPITLNPEWDEQHHLSQTLICMKLLNRVNIPEDGWQSCVDFILKRDKTEFHNFFTIVDRIATHWHASPLPPAEPRKNSDSPELKALTAKVDSLAAAVAKLVEVKSSPPPAAAQPSHTPRPAQAKSQPPLAAAPAPQLPKPSPPKPNANPELLVSIPNPPPVWLPALQPVDAVLALNAALASRPDTRGITVFAMRRSSKGNLVFTAGPGVTQPQFADIAGKIDFSAVLMSTSRKAGSSSAPISNCSATANVPWAKLQVDGVPTGVNSYAQAYTSDAILQSLLDCNPSLRGLHITQPPSWVRKPKSYAHGSSSSFTFAFQDPTGDLAKTALAGKRVFVLGVHATVKRWTPTSKRSRQAADPTANSTPASAAAQQPVGASQQNTQPQPRGPPSPGAPPPGKKRKGNP
jgi:hypothetical protein